MLFFGLALVFGAVGMIGSTGLDIDVTPKPTFNSGNTMAGADTKIINDAEYRVGNQATDDEYLRDIDYNLAESSPSSAQESAVQAFMLLT